MIKGIRDFFVDPPPEMIFKESVDSTYKDGTPVTYTTYAGIQYDGDDVWTPWVQPAGFLYKLLPKRQSLSKEQATTAARELGQAFHNVLIVSRDNHLKEKELPNASDPT